MGYYITRLLFGHGCFRAYLNKLKKSDSLFCPQCAIIQKDAEHVFLQCPRIIEKREELKRLLGVLLTPETIVDQMMEITEAWEAAVDFAEKVLKILCNQQYLQANTFLLIG